MVTGAPTSRTRTVAQGLFVPIRRSSREGTALVLDGGSEQQSFETGQWVTVPNDIAPLVPRIASIGSRTSSMYPSAYAPIR